jgi:hypothetical protein
MVERMIEAHVGALDCVWRLPEGYDRLASGGWALEEGLRVVDQEVAKFGRAQ